MDGQLLECRTRAVRSDRRNDQVTMMTGHLIGRPSNAHETQAARGG
jgi:hypothetical protein